MLNIKTIRITTNVPFQMYLLSDRKVKRLCKEFEFYGVKIYREERVKASTVCMDYPEGNLYWFVDFKKYLTTEILEKDVRYKDDWLRFLNRLKTIVKEEANKFNEDIASITNEQILSKMRKYDLRNYQAYDLLNLEIIMKHNSIPAGLILSEQRTGKTRVAIAACLDLIHTGSTILVVCPKSACVSWKDEFVMMNKHLKGDLFKIAIVKHLKDLKDCSEHFSDHYNVKIISYGLFKILSIPQIRTLVDLTNTDEIMFISDESHRLRNYDTMQSEAIFNFKDICMKNKLKTSVIGITGTPAVKESTDVFGVLSLINFSKIQFRPYDVALNSFKEYFYNCEDTSYGKVCKSIRRSSELEYLIKTNAVQTKQEHLDMFKNYTVKRLKYILPMDEQQKAIYKSVFDTMEFEDDIDCMNGLVQLMRLQQICVDPSTLVSSYEALAPKLKWIVEFAKKNKIQFIVMSKKLQPLITLEKVFIENGISYTTHNGSLGIDKRNTNISKFKNHEVQVFLIQSDTGKENLTLPEAKATIFLDRDFAQGFNEQAEARMTPIDGATCTKYVIDLLMQDSIEEGIYNVLVNKKQSIDTINTVFKIIKKGE